MSESQAQVPDFSYLSTFAECLRKGYYRYKLHLRPKGEVNIPMHAGSALHVGFHTLVMEGWNVEAAVQKMREKWGEVDPGFGRYAYLTVGHAEVVLRYLADDQKDWPLHPISLDGIPLAETPILAAWGPLGYGGILDNAFANAGGGRYGLDLKCTTGWVNESLAQDRAYAISHQFRGYLGMANEMGAKLDGFYVLGVYMGEGLTGDWSKRKSERSKLFGPYSWSGDLIEETRQWVAGWSEVSAGTSLAEEDWPQNVGWGCRRCEFKKLCEAPPITRATLTKIAYARKPPTGKLLSGADADDD